MRAQLSTEYIIIVGFISFAVLGILAIAYYYSGSTQDKIVDTQIESLGEKITRSAESVFYSGAPSQATIFVYVPDSINSISVGSDGKELIINSNSHSGVNIRSFTSIVALEIDSSTRNNPGFVTKGTKKLRLVAESNKVVISLV